MTTVTETIQTITAWIEREVAANYARLTTNILPQLYAGSPVWLKRMLDDAAPYSDVIAMSVLFTFIALRFSEYPKKPNWTLLIASGFCFAGTLVYLGLQVAQLIAFQMHAYQPDYDPKVTPDGFVAKLPLDLVFGFTKDNATELFQSIGKVGVPVYQNYLIWDTVNIIFYTIPHFILLTYLYNESDPLSFVASKVPFVLAALDAYENFGHYYMTLVGGPNGVSSVLLDRIQGANSAKFATMFVVLGMEISGFGSKFFGAVQTEIQDAGVTATGTTAQKKAEEKRKARLAKKKE
ncbi:hypothetical protein HDV05_005821 [Chytridiales sp. JEL 0842]|nr:hypothetical protein HDV05_005821 [Chytridiales sp. JEL 0842]